MPNTVTLAAQKKRTILIHNETQQPILAAVTSMVRTFILLFIGFGIGATVTLTNTVLDDVQNQDRKLVESTPIDDLTILSETDGSYGYGSIPTRATQPQMIRRPQATTLLSNQRQQPVRDVETNGRKWNYPNEKESIKERLQLVEHHLQSLKWTIPPTSQLSQLSHQQQQAQAAATPRPTTISDGKRTEEDIEFCRKHVFVTQHESAKDDELDKFCNSPQAKRFNVCHDLADFTGLSMQEVIVRMARSDHYHFEEEHLFWNPKTRTELAWYYSTSQSYLFANAIHRPLNGILDRLQKEIHEPVLDFSGGVGNSVLYLALDRGLQCQYFGIGMIEKAFAQFRVAKRGLQDKITFLDPWSEGTSWKFDPIQALPRDGSLGAILAVDVLEHIPDYQHTVTAMVDSLKVGGVIVEKTPFASTPIGSGNGEAVDTRIHVHNGGITMEQAMGDRMVYRQIEGYWEKIKEA